MIDILQTWYGDGFRINEYITIHQPTVEEIIKFGEEKYFDAVYTLCAIPSDIKSVLADIGKDYSQTSDFECFCLLSKTLTKEQTGLLLGDLEFKQFDTYTRKETGEIYLYNRQKNIVISQYIYYMMIDYIRKIHYIIPKVEKPANNFTKQYLIDEDRQKRQNHTSFTSILFPLLSTMLCKPGFKYKKPELNTVGIMEFMDAVQRMQIIDSVTALMNGMYSGMIDTKKIKESELNQFKEIEFSPNRGMNITISQ